MYENKNGQPESTTLNLRKLGNEIKEKFTQFFKKKEVLNTKETVSPSRSSLNKNSERKSNESKQVFTIQEDEDHQVYNYNLDNEEEEYEEDEYLEEENLQEEKAKNRINEPLPQKIIEEIHSTTTTNLDEVPEDEDLEVHTTCHQLYTKESYIDLEGLAYVKFHKMKPANTANKIFSMIGFNKTKMKEEPYIALFDENFIYILKDIKIDSTNDFIKRAKNHYNIKNTTSVDVRKLENGQTKISIVFTLNKSFDNYLSKIKEFYFDKGEEKKFLKLLKIFFKRLKLEVQIADSK